MLRIEPPRRRLVAITFLRHRQRDDLRLARRQAPPYALALLLLEQHLTHAADDAPARALRTLLDRRVETVLRRHTVAHARRAQAHAADAPCAAALRERVVGVDRLVCAMKRADAEMDDADADVADCISRTGDVGWKPVQRGKIEPRHAIRPFADVP